MSSLKNKLSDKIIQEENQDQNDKIININQRKFVGTLEQLEHERVAPEFVLSMEEAKERIAMLQNFVKEMMIPNIDYGVIPSCNKPTLFKAGAEKLCDIFGFSKQLEILNRIEDWEKGIFNYEVKVILINKKTGIIEAEGIGACNSKERKYKGQDSYSIVNTILKMAKKRALIDAVLSATRSSDIFTQDIEDMNIEDNMRSNSRNKFKKDIKTKLISKEQQAQILLVMQQNKIMPDYAKAMMYEKYKVNESKKLTEEQANEFIDLLKCSSMI